MKKFAVCLLVVLLTAIVVVSTANADLKEVKPTYELFAEQGNADAQFFLGTMYAKGGGVLQNYKMAHMYFNISAANGLDIGGKSRNVIEGQMTTQQIADAQQMAYEWMAKH